MVMERFHQLAMEAMVVKEEKVVNKDFFCILSVFVYFETMIFSSFMLSSFLSDPSPIIGNACQ